MLEQLLRVLVIQFCGLNAANSMAFMCTRLLAATVLNRKTDCHEVLDGRRRLDFPNALMYGIAGMADSIGNGSLLGGLSRNQQSCVHADDQQRSHAEYSGATESAKPDRVTAVIFMVNTGTTLFCKRNRKNQCHHSAYRVVTADLSGGKGRQMQDSGSCIWDSFYRGLLCRGRSGVSSHLCD